jgi:hypothetical protein
MLKRVLGRVTEECTDGYVFLAVAIVGMFAFMVCVLVDALRALS